MMKNYKYLTNFILKTFAVLIIMGGVLVSSVFAQDKFLDKIYPVGKDWSVNCKIYRLTSTHVLLKFPNQKEPTEILRTSIKKVEYENSRQVFFNKYGQISAEINIPVQVFVKKVLNPGIIEISDGSEVVLNGIDYTIPVDSLDQIEFHRGSEFIRSQIENHNVMLQFDKKRKDEFGRMTAYIIMADGRHLNMEIIKRGFCPVDRASEMIYLQDFIELEESAKAKKVGIWSKDRNSIQ